MALYRSYDRAALDAQYNLRAAVPAHPTYFERWARDSAAARRDPACRPDLSYGPSDAERLDLFPVRRAAGPSPLLLFVHGGYWRSLDARDFGFLAPAFTDAGIAYASLNYGLAPDVTVQEIVRQCRAALVWLWQAADALEIDRERLYVAGHSAGGHLAALLLLTDWAGRAPGLPAGLVRGACAVSGVFDLEPMRLCYLNDSLGLDAATVRALSPMHVLADADAAGPLILAVGGDETDEFLRQQADFAAAWRTRGFACEVVDLPGDHHFSAVEALARADHPLCKSVKVMIAR